MRDGRIEGEVATQARPKAAKSKTESRMEDALSALEPGSVRYETLRSAIRFKRSWLDLAKRLSDLSASGDYREWGFRTLEAYAQHELHLRRDTTQKLLRSYGFLSEHETEALQSNERNDVPLPSYQAIDALAAARETPYLSEDDYRKLRDHVFAEDPTPSQVKRLVLSHAPESYEAEAEADAVYERRKKCLALAERLLAMVEEDKTMAERVTTQLEAVVGALRQFAES